MSLLLSATGVVGATISGSITEWSDSASGGLESIVLLSGAILSSGDIASGVGETITDVLGSIQEPGDLVTGESLVISLADNSGGFEYARLGRRRTKEEVRKEREDFGVFQRASEVIDRVARRQVESLETDEQKRFEELSREIELEGLLWNMSYLELLNAQRTALIDSEIAELMKKQRDLQNLEEETTLLMILSM